MTSSDGINDDSRQGIRLRKINTKYFTMRWKSGAGGVEGGEKSGVKTAELAKGHEEVVPEGRIGFFKTIRKRLNIKSICKSKRKISAVESAKSTEDVGPSDRPVSLTDDRHEADVNERVGMPVDDSEAGSRTSRNNSSSDTLKKTEESSSSSNSTQIPSESAQTSGASEIPSSSRLTPEENSSQVVQKSGETSLEEEKGTLSKELMKLSDYGWYWGPISGDEADAKLQGEPDGAFLIRDSSDDRYLLTLSFKSAGKLLHARIEHSGGMFSLCTQGDSGRFSSVPALIEHSMNSSKSAVFCYSRPRYPGHPAFPVRLTKPVSRNTQVRSLQYLCRFVIRKNTRLDNIHKLPLPNTIKGYIEEAHY